MILADDNFATIVAAVEEGRSVYDNLQKFLRIQIANLFMFILAFLGSSAFQIAGTALLIPSQVLWIHMAVVAPIGAVMGLDVANPGIMRRKPRPFNQALIVRSMMVRLFVNGLFMAAATLVLVQIGKTTYDSLEVGQTMALVGLSLMNVFLALNLRFPEDSAFGSATFSNPKLLWAFAWAFVGAMLITQMRVLQDLFHTVPLDGRQWAIVLVPGVVLLVLGELYKVILRFRRAHDRASDSDPTATSPLAG
jgi:Ca2+-transporting ATPase